MMFGLNKSECNLFANCVFMDLNITKAFGGHVIRPLYGGRVIVFNGDGTICEHVQEVEVLQDICDVLNCFGTFVDGVDFSFGGTTGGDGLAFGLPVERTTKPNDESGNRTTFPEFE